MKIQVKGKIFDVDLGSVSGVLRDFIEDKTIPEWYECICDGKATVVSVLYASLLLSYPAADKFLCEVVDDFNRLWKLTHGDDLMSVVPDDGIGS